MKLTNTQINALANKFYDDLKDANTKKNQSSYDNKIKALLPVFNKAKKILNTNSYIYSLQLNVGNDKICMIYKTTTFESFSSSFTMKNAFNITSNLPHIDNIKQDIILATIDTNSVEEIMNNLKKKYK